jgi:hypothetical protein
VPRLYSGISDNHCRGSYSGVKRISGFSERIFKKISGAGNLEYAALKRRENFLYLKAILETDKIASDDLIQDNLDDWDVPYFMALRFRFGVYDLVDNLRHNGLPFITWPRLDNQSENFQEAENLRRYLLLIPVHESLGKRHIRYMVKKLTEGIRGRGIYTNE